MNASVRAAHSAPRIQDASAHILTERAESERMNQHPILRVANLSKAYHAALGPVPVLEHVNITIQRGEVVSLVGPSGAGKSTLLSLMAGLLLPDDGIVAVDGVDLASLGERDRSDLRARVVGIALQHDNLIPFLNARENVELAFGFVRARASSVSAMAMLERFGVAHRHKHLPRQLSGGEAQRVALAVALANDPLVLLADEIVTQLDAETASDVLEAVFDERRAIMYVTHDVALADRADLRLELIDRTVVAR